MMTVKEFAEFSRAEVNAAYSDLFSRVRGPISVQNEFRVLRALAAICRMRLASYERPIGENVAILKDESVPMFSNRRNVVALVGEGNGGVTRRCGRSSSCWRTICWCSRRRRSTWRCR